MKIATIAAAAAFAVTSTLAFAQSTNTPGASKVGGEPNPMKDSQSMQPNSGSGGTTGSSMPSTKDASKSGAPNADNAQRPGGPSNTTNMNK